MSQTTNDAADDATELSLSDRYAIMSEARRRVTLSALTEQPSTVSLETLAAEVAQREGDAPDPDPEHVDRVAVSLHHIHLPMMDDHDVLCYDADQHRVEQVGTLPMGPQP